MIINLRKEIEDHIKSNKKAIKAIKVERCGVYSNECTLLFYGETDKVPECLNVNYSMEEFYIEGVIWYTDGSWSETEDTDDFSTYWVYHSCPVYDSSKESVYAHKKVNYFDQEFVVPEWVEYLAIDNEGTICAYSERPVIDDEWGMFTLNFNDDFDDLDKFMTVGELDLYQHTDLEWEKSLVKV